MLLNNFRRVLVNTISSGLRLNLLDGMASEVKTTAGTVYSPSGTYKDTPTLGGLGNNCRICTVDTQYNSADVPASNFSFSGGAQIYLGTGNTAPTIDDYKLSGDLITGLTSQVQNTSATNNSITFSATATNNTDAPVTIKEIGLGGFESSAGACVVLLTRDVLATPVTLNVGDSKTFSITIDFRSLTDTTVNQ